MSLQSEDETEWVEDPVARMAIDEIRPVVDRFFDDLPEDIDDWLCEFYYLQSPAHQLTNVWDKIKIDETIQELESCITRATRLFMSLPNDVSDAIDKQFYANSSRKLPNTIRMRTFFDCSEYEEP